MDLPQFNLDNIEFLINKKLIEKKFDKTIIFKLSSNNYECYWRKM